MAFNFRLPHITEGSDREMVMQLKTYMYQMTEQLQWALNTIDSSVSQTAVQSQKRQTVVQTPTSQNPVMPIGEDERRVDVDGEIHGGAIDNLTLGTMLIATADAPITLADTRKPGCYYSPNATNTQYITDSPYRDGGFGLEVRQMQHKDYIRQTLYYGRTTIWRHYNGSEWSDWVRLMVSTEFETACTDFVIEHGTSGGWTYQKWKSGRYDMYGMFEVKATSVDQNTTVYRTNAIKVATPFAITDDAVVTGTATGFYWLSNGVYSDSKNVSIRIVSDKTISLTNAITVRLHAVGTYA